MTPHTLHIITQLGSLGGVGVLAVPGFISRCYDILLVHAQRYAAERRCCWFTRNRKNESDNLEHLPIQAKPDVAEGSQLT